MIQGSNINIKDIIKTKTQENKTTTGNGRNNIYFKRKQKMVKI